MNLFVRNLAGWDRISRIAAALGLGACAVVAPLELPLRLGIFGASALYLAVSALWGTCLGYRLLGVSSCARTAAR